MQPKHILFAAALFIGSAADAQQTGGCNSTYSRFGLGTLSDASSSTDAVMGGSGVGLRYGTRINSSNPASYSACDSISLIFDVGLQMHIGSFSNGTVTRKIKNTNISNVAAMFRVRKGLGMSLGFVPYTSIGYNFTNSGLVGTAQLTQKPITTTRVYSGDGGLHMVYIGAGYNPFKNFSIGANIGYLWGSYNHSMVQTYYEGGTVSSNYDGLHTKYDADLTTYKADIGVQYRFPLPGRSSLVAGATVGIGHKIAGTANMLRYTSNGDTISRAVPKAYDIPWSYSAGVAYYKDNKWIVNASYTMERWGECRMPDVTSSGLHASELSMEAVKGLLEDRHRAGIGCEYTPNAYSISYLQRVHYRIGATLATPYYKVNDRKGPMEYTVGVGFGLPIRNDYNNRSAVNVGFQWARVQPGSGSDIVENYFRLNIGLTFNEQWFKKWRIR